MIAIVGLGLVACEPGKEHEGAAVSHEPGHSHADEHSHEEEADHRHDEPETEAFYGEEAEQDIEGTSPGAGHDHDGETPMHSEHHDEGPHNHEDMDGHQH